MEGNVYTIDTIDASKIDDKYMEKFLIFLINSKINLKDIKWINLGKRKFYEREFILLLKLILSQFSELKEHSMLNPFKNWQKKAALQEDSERIGKFLQKNSFWWNSLVLFKYQAKFNRNFYMNYEKILKILH